MPVNESKKASEEGGLDELELVGQVSSYLLIFLAPRSFPHSHFRITDVVSKFAVVVFPGV